MEFLCKLQESLFAYPSDIEVSKKQSESLESVILSILNRFKKKKTDLSSSLHASPSKHKNLKGFFNNYKIILNKLYLL